MLANQTRFPIAKSDTRRSAGSYFPGCVGDQVGTRRHIAAVVLVVTAVLATGCQHSGSSPDTPESTGPTATRALAPHPTGPPTTATQSDSPAPEPPATTTQSDSATTEPSTSSPPAVTVTVPRTSAPAPDGPEVFTIVLTTRQVGTLSAVVSPMTVSADAAIVNPPEPAGCPWAGPGDVENHGDVPAGCDWSDTSIWVRNASFPTSPAKGITYVYGHACRSHICPFSAVQETPGGGYTVQPGDVAVITTSAATLTYRVCAVASSPKHGGPAVQPSCPSTVDLDIITCGYGPNDVSTKNIVIAATLIASAK